MKWMFKTEVHSDLGVSPSFPLLGFKLPDDRCEVHLRNLEMTPGVSLPLMEVFLIFESDHNEHDYSGAIGHAEIQLERVLGVMTMVAGARLQVHRRICIADWRTGITERRGAVFTTHGNPELPQLLLNADFAETTLKLLHSNGNAAVDRALRWFSAAVAASHPEEQFEYFWFVLETLALAFRNVAKVPDVCAVCRQPLQCPNCGGPSLHRPYPKQAIAQLLERFAPKYGLDPVKLFADGNELRNALQHGEDVGDAERRIGTSVSELVDKFARTSRLALFEALGKTSTLRGTLAFRGLEPSTFLHYRMQSTSVVSRPCDPEKAPSLNDFPPNIKVDLIVEERQPDHKPKDDNTRDGR